MEYWSPNRILLTRTGEGPIKINVNPGSYWVVNGERRFKDMRVVELEKEFILNENISKYELVVMPPL